MEGRNWGGKYPCPADNSVIASGTCHKRLHEECHVPNILHGKGPLYGNYGLKER